MIRRCEMILTGHVQGVGLRAATQRRAHAAGLTGWVMNKKDGSVFVVVEGELPSIVQLSRWFEQGFGKGLSIFVQKKWGEPKEEFQDFSIRFEEEM
ncbi:MAG TPA: acylphosphatase [Patescibacteria group bacterium]|nr:acylphosphatase [Patescibacteria group bacterium]